MSELFQSIVPIIEAAYESFTPVEKDIADFFIQNTDETRDFSAKSIAKDLNVSDASLTRFAKKCGYAGYRAFIYEYQSNNINKSSVQSEIIKRVLHDYNELLNKTYSLIDEIQLEKLTSLLAKASRVYIYGKGSSGLAAKEMKIRFMRMGMICEAITDDDVMIVNHVVVDKDCVVIGFSISGTTEVVMNSLERASAKDATTILFTTQSNLNGVNFLDEIINVASVMNLNYGNRISPQFPLLVVMDIIYDYFLNMDRLYKGELFDYTLDALDRKDDL